MKPILSVECDEPKGKVWRNVYPMALDEHNLRLFWEKARHYKTLFTREIKDDFKAFLDIFVAQDLAGNLVGKGLLWRVDGPTDDMVGVFYLTNIEPEDDALAHFTFFDGRIRGRDDLTKQMIQYVFAKYHFRRLTTHAPAYVIPGTIHFIERLGFKREGKKRAAAFYNGEWFDMNLYGILADEVANGS